MTETPRAKSLSLLEYLSVVRRWKWIVLQTVLLVPVAAFVFSLQQQELHQASAEVLLSRQSLGSALVGIDDASRYDDPRRVAQTQADLARVPDLAQRVLEKAGAPGDVMEFLERSSVHPKPNADLLVFEVVHPDPDAAIALANAYAEEFTAFRRRLDTETLRAARLQLERRIAALTPSEGAAPGAGASATVRDTLLQTEEQLRTLEALQTAGASVVRTASLAEQVQPRLLRNVGLALALGLALGLGLAFLLEALDRRVRSEEEVQERLGAPLLARLPAPPRRLRRTQTPTLVARPHGAHAEAYRTLRTSLEFASLGRDVKTLMVTSSVESEGKSTTAIELALAFARAGRRTALVDLDLRRPTLEKFFRTPRRPGIAEVVLGHVRLEDALVRVNVLAEGGAGRANGNGNGNGNGGDPRSLLGTLEFLPAGVLPPDPSEFVASAAVSGLLAEVASRADVVIVDAPPLLGVGDALTLSARVDGVLVVVDIARARRPLLGEAARLLASAQAAVLGFVVTGRGAPEGVYGYHYPAHSDRETSEPGGAPVEALRRG